MVVTVAWGTLEWTAGGVAQLVQGGQAIRLAGVNPIQVASVRTPAPTKADVELVWEPYWTPEKMDPRVRSLLWG